MPVEFHRAETGLRALGPRRLFRLRTLIAAAGLALSAAGCDYPGASVGQGPMLAQSGFEQLAADTPQRQAALAQMPPYTLVRKRWNGQMLYAYTGDAACRCIYIGNDTDFARYQQNMYDAQRWGTAASNAQVRRGREQQQSFVVREDSNFDPAAWGIPGAGS